MYVYYMSGGEAPWILKRAFYSIADKREKQKRIETGFHDQIKELAYWRKKLNLKMFSSTDQSVAHMIDKESSLPGWRDYVRKRIDGCDLSELLKNFLVRVGLKEVKKATKKAKKREDRKDWALTALEWMKSVYDYEREYQEGTLEEMPHFYENHVPLWYFVAHWGYESYRQLHAPKEEEYYMNWEQKEEETVLFLQASTKLKAEYFGTCRNFIKRLQLSLRDELLEKIKTKHKDMREVLKKQQEEYASILGSFSTNLHQDTIQQSAVKIMNRCKELEEIVGTYTP